MKFLYFCQCFVVDKLCNSNSISQFQYYHVFGIFRLQFLVTYTNRPISVLAKTEQKYWPCWCIGWTIHYYQSYFADTILGLVKSLFSVELKKWCLTKVKTSFNSDAFNKLTQTAENQLNINFKEGIISSEETKLLVSFDTLQLAMCYA